MKLRWLARIPPVAITVLMVVAMADMLAGVFLRYVMTRLSDWFDLPRVDFFWVEEVGEFCLTWLTLIGAAVGIWKGSHFTLQIFTPRLPFNLRRAIASLNAVLIAVFGILVAAYGWQVALINGDSFSPGLSINLFWLYLAAVVGGLLAVVYSLATLARIRRSGSLMPPEGL